MKFVRHSVVSWPKLKEREEAINLREQGFTYSEILERVPVAKSTLSVWLGSVGLTKKQEQRITEKKKAAMQRGWEARRRTRIGTTERIHKKALTQVGRISARDLWLIGIALYWAEGSKAKPHSPSTGFIFSNSDYRMLRVMRIWFRLIGIPEDDVEYSLYIHMTHHQRIREACSFWTTKLSIPASKLQRVYFKRNILSTSRKNVGNEYHGLVRIRIRRSTNLNRVIAGWIDGVVTEASRAKLGGRLTVGQEALNL